MQSCHRLCACCLWIMTLFVVVPASASPTADSKIPPNSYGCTLCHTHGAVTPELVPSGAESPLSEFGAQWLALDVTGESGRLWSELAKLNADADGCSNGYEMGDPRGDFVPGAQFEGISGSDPNRDDCSLPLNSESWSTLKALFSDG